MAEKKAEYKEISSDLIDIGAEQSRVRGTEKNLDELMKNIKENGLINPVTVFLEDGRFLLIAGQRRFLATQKLGWKTIPAKIIPKPDDPAMAKIISLSENIIREDLTYNDCADAFMALYKKYGSIAAVVTETAIPRHIVDKHLKYEALPNKLKELVDDQQVNIQLAKKASTASTNADGEVDEEKAVRLAMAMKRELPKPEQRRALTDLAGEEPSKPVEELIEEAKKTAAVKISVTLGSRWYSALQNAAKDYANDEEEVASNAIIEWLDAKGYT
jgi:ParB family chromosome partitioning protein